MHAPLKKEEISHTGKWAYQKLYRANVFELAESLFPYLGRIGFQAVSRTVAWTYAVTQPAIRQIVQNNLALLGPATARDAVRVFVNYGAAIADYVAIGVMEPKKVIALCDECLGLEHLKEATRDGSGVILATGHYSFFEFGAVVLSHMGYKVSIATLPEPSSDLCAWREKWRARWGTETITVGSDPFSSLTAIHALQAGRCMAVLADRPFGERGIPVDLPGGRSLFSPSPAMLSWISGCKVLPVAVRRLPGGKYRITAHAPVQARSGSGESRDAEIARCTREIAAALFAEIRHDPRQWYQFVPVGL